VTIAYRGIGTTLSGTTASLPLAHPTAVTIAPGDLLVAVLHFKPSAANGAVAVSPPPGWQLAGSKTNAGGYATTIGIDTGNTSIFVYWKLAAGDGSETGTAAFTASGHNVALGAMLHLSTTTEWGATFGVSTGEQASAPAGPVAIATAEQVPQKPGGFIIAAAGFPTDVMSTPGTVFSGPVLTHSGGSTINIPTTVRTTWTSLNNDLGLVLMTATVPVGTTASTGTLSFTSPLSSGLTTTNIRGPFIALSIREGGMKAASAGAVSVVAPPAGRRATSFSIPKVQVDSPQALLEAGVAPYTRILVESPPGEVGTTVPYGDIRASLALSVPSAGSVQRTTATAAAAEGSATTVEVQVWDPANETMLAVVEGRYDLSWLDDFNDSGRGAFSLHRMDPKATLQNLALLNIVKYVYAGRTRYGWRIEARNPEVVGAEGFSDQVWKISGRGLLSLLSDAVVYPEYGVDEFTKPQRNFSFASREGPWYVASEWVTPRGLPLSAVPDDHPWKGFPSDWPDPDAQWLWSTDPNSVANPATHWFRSSFFLDKATTVTVYASADDKVLLYVDGFPVLATVDGDKHSFRRASQFSLNLGKGFHLIAAEVVNTNDAIEEVVPPVTTYSPAYASDSNRPYIGRGFSDGRNPYVNNDGSVDGGGTGAAAFDGNPATWWMSVGNYLGWSSAYEWVEGTFAQARVTAVKVKVRGGPYTVYISLKDGENGWNGSETIPYSARAVDAGTRIRYSRIARIEADQEAVINIPPQVADRIRITLKADWDSGVWQYRWRAALYGVEVTSEPRESSYIRGGNFAGLLVSVCEMDDKGAVARVVANTYPEGWLVKTGERPGWRPAHILVALVGEAKSRSVLGLVPLQLGFTDSVDSYGKPWTGPRKDVAYNVGETYLSVVGKLTEDSDIDVWMDPENLILHAAPTRGGDLSVGPSTVMLIPGDNLTGLSVDNRRPMSTRMLVETAFGWLEVGNFESEMVYGRVEGLISLGNVLSLQEARTTTGKELERFSIESFDVTMSHTAVTGPAPYLDYDVGDIVLAPVGFSSTFSAFRVMSVRATEKAAGVLDVGVELDKKLAAEELLPPIASDQFPGAADIGVPDDAQLNVLTNFNKPYAGDSISGGVLTITTEKAVYENWNMPFLVEVRARGVVIRNCLITGLGIMPTGSALVDVAPDGSAQALVERCTIIPDFPAPSAAAGVRGSAVAVQACEISGTVDGVQVVGPAGNRTSTAAGRSSVVGSWIHDLPPYPDAGGPEGFTANDGVHVRGGAAISVRGNRFEGAIRRSAVRIDPEVNNVSGVSVRDNLIACASSRGIDVYDKHAGGTAPVQGLDLTGNTFRKGLQTYQIMISGTTLDIGASVSGNVWEDGSQPPPPVHRGA
jgi:hypothetical protein